MASLPSSSFDKPSAIKRHEPEGKRAPTERLDLPRGAVGPASTTPTDQNRSVSPEILHPLVRDPAALLLAAVLLALRRVVGLHEFDSILRWGIKTTY